MKRSRILDALFAEQVLGCKIVWRDVERKESHGFRCGDHSSGKEPECHCEDPWTGPGISGKEHCHFGPARHDLEESERCRAIPYYSDNLETLVKIVQDRWTDVSMESSGLNWTVTTPIASFMDTDLNVALIIAAVKSTGYAPPDGAETCKSCQGYGKAVGADGGFYTCPECLGVGHVH